MKQKFGRKLDNNLMWYGTLPCCDVLFIEINSKIKCNYVRSFVPIILSPTFNSVAQLLRGFTTNLAV